MQSETLQIRHGITGNYYAFCINKEPVIQFCLQINKPTSCIYFNKKYNVWVIRIKSKQSKEIIKNLKQNS